jgi:hypothetical protein
LQAQLQQLLQQEPPQELPVPQARLARPAELQVMVAPPLVVLPGEYWEEPLMQDSLSQRR